MTFRTANGTGNYSVPGIFANIVLSEPGSKRFTNGRHPDGCGIDYLTQAEVMKDWKKSYKRK